MPKDNHHSSIILDDTKSDNSSLVSPGITPWASDQTQMSRGIGFHLKSTVSPLLAGLLPILLLGLIAGVFSKGGAFHQNGYFSELANSLSFAFYLIPATLAFAIIARVVRDWFLVAYPLVVWFVGPSGITLHPAAYISGLLPTTTDMTYALAVALMYVIVYLVLKPVHYMVAARKIPVLRERRVARIAYGIITAVGLAIIVACIALGTYLHIQQARDRSSIHIPSDAVYASSSPEFINGKYYEFSVIHAAPTTYKDMTYQVEETVTATRLKKWWVKDTLSNCGMRTWLNTYSGKFFPNDIKKTPSGIEYAVAVSDDSQEPGLSDWARQYKVTGYCWVFGNFTYRVTTHNRESVDREKYPISQLIDDIAKAPARMAGCEKDKSTKLSKPKPVFYCKAEDISALRALDDDMQKRYTMSLGGAQEKQKAAEALSKIKTYTEIGRITIPQWGISFPISEEIKDATYTVDLPSTEKELFIGLRGGCPAGTEKDARGAIKNVRYGVAHILRTETSKLRPGSSGVWTQIGGYSYALGANANPDCATLSGDWVAIRGAFEWAGKNIR